MVTWQRFLLVITVKLERRGQFHQGDVVVEAFGSVLGVINDPLHGHRLSAVDRLLCHAHVDAPHGRVGKAVGTAGESVIPLFHRMLCVSVRPD